MKFEYYGTDTIRDYLLKKDKPIYEVELLRYVTGEKRLPAGDSFLFAVHFSLFNALYRLRYESGDEGYYLHLDPMRIRLIELPHRQRCSYYFPFSGEFCNNDVLKNGYCHNHMNEFNKVKDALIFEPLREFYLNEENISFGKSELLKKLMNGIAVYAFKKGEVEKALEFFGLTNPNKKIVQNRYRELAKKYHPDKNKNNDILMKNLNESYQVLCEVYVV